MNIFFYNTNIIYTQIIKDILYDITPFNNINHIINLIDDNKLNNDEQLFIIPINILNNKGCLSSIFKMVGRNDDTLWLLIGTQQQLNDIMINNIAFLKNYISIIILPIDFDIIATVINTKIKNIIG